MLRVAFGIAGLISEDSSRTAFAIGGTVSESQPRTDAISAAHAIGAPTQSASVSAIVNVSAAQSIGAPVQAARLSDPTIASAPSYKLKGNAGSFSLTGSV